MTAKLFEPLTIRGVSFRNRIAMSPMCMHSATADGRASDFHTVHYGARALGGVGLVMLETAAVLPNGVLGEGDLGIWDDAQIEGLSSVVETIHSFGSRAGAQIGHTGRKLGLPGQQAVAPSPLPYGPHWPTPQELTREGIAEVVGAFRAAARRARAAGFDVLEVHAAHGYLLNQFLSPLSNHRRDEYGGSHENRYRIVRQVLEAVRLEWEGPLFARISATDYAEGGNTQEDFVVFGKWMKEQGVDLIDASSGGTASEARVRSFPNFQVPAAELIRREVGIATGAVGVIQTGPQAEEILQKSQADIVLIGREMLRDPFWARTAADDLREQVQPPAQYTRYGSAWQRTLPPLPAAPLEETVAA